MKKFFTSLLLLSTSVFLISTVYANDYHLLTQVNPDDHTWQSHNDVILTAKIRSDEVFTETSLYSGRSHLFSSYVEMVKNEILNFTVVDDDEIKDDIIGKCTVYANISKLQPNEMFLASCGRGLINVALLPVSERSLTCIELYSQEVTFKGLTQKLNNCLKYTSNEFEQALVP